MWLLLSAILWLGNITFDKTSDDTVTVRSDEALANAAELLSVREEDLARALSERTLSAGARACPRMRAPARCTEPLSLLHPALQPLRVLLL